jgi:CheY-like chemotaxis protein
MLAVLVVDDEQAVRENLAAYLEDEGMRVIEAESGEHAVDLAGAGEQFDVCIMDMRLPGMDGNATIVALHQLRPDLMFLVHTGSANYALPPELRALGMTEEHVFMKPLANMGVLADAIRAVSDQ